MCDIPAWERPFSDMESAGSNSVFMEFDSSYSAFMESVSSYKYPSIWEGIIAERMNTQYADTYFPAVSRYSLYMTSAIRWRIRNTITLVFAVDVRLRLLRRASCS